MYHTETEVDENTGTLILDATCVSQNISFPQDVNLLNEASNVLIAAVVRYFKRTGHYPERVLPDKIYQSRANLGYCREHGIRLTGPSLGRLKKNTETDRKTAYKDDTDRIA